MRYQVINYETTSWSFPSYPGLIMLCLRHPHLHDFQLFGPAAPVGLAILAFAFDWVAAIAAILDSAHCGVSPRATPMGDAATKTPENCILLRGFCVHEGIGNINCVLQLYMHEPERFILSFLKNIVEVVILSCSPPFVMLAGPCYTTSPPRPVSMRHQIIGTKIEDFVLGGLF